MYPKNMKWLTLALVFFLLIFTAGCGGSGDGGDVSGDGDAGEAGSQEPEDGGDQAAEKMVLILPGPINDQSWNATNYAGLVAANESLGTDIEYVENVQDADFESTFRNYAERGYGLIMAAGTQFDEAANVVAPNFPDSMFCVVNGLRADNDNVAPIFPKEYEASYMGALIAGQISPKGQFGTIGAFPNEQMEDLLDVYEHIAVEVAKEKGQEDAKAVRAYANSWEDVSLGKQMAETMIDNGADTLFVYANQVGLGAIQATKEKGAKFVGFSGDQTTIAPDTVVASIVFDFEELYIWAVEKYMDGVLEGNQVNSAGIAEGVFYPVYTENVSQDIQDFVEENLEAYLAGEVDLVSIFQD